MPLTHPLYRLNRETTASLAAKECLLWWVAFFLSFLLRMWIWNQGAEGMAGGVRRKVPVDGFPC